MATSDDSKGRSRTATNRRAARERRGADRRAGAERRQAEQAVDVERRAGAERREQGPEAERRKVERRINEYVLKAEVLEFINAVNAFKSVHQKPFPTWSEIYEIFLSLGYRKPE